MPTDAAQLTLAQKASLVTGSSFWSTQPIPDAGVASVTMTDGPHGVRRQQQGTDHLGLHHAEPATCFPPAVAVGSSWSAEVAARVGAALAVESRALGVGVLLGPGINIKRSPLGGRNFEYYSEDPLLSGELASAYVRALQAGGVGASLKHFAANDQETDRMTISSDVDERTLREVHLSAFERVVTDAAPATVMCSYNRINGVYASENHWLLTEVLREEWGYEGAVVSDWGAVRDRVRSLEAGLDLAMPGPQGLQAQAIVDAVESGRLDVAVVDRAAERVLGLQRWQPDAASAFDVDAHHELARELAAECAVLLRNDGEVLPLAGGSRILVTGEFAIDPRYQGGGSSHVNATRVDAPFEGIEAFGAARGCEVRFERGFDSADTATADALRDAAVAAAAEADVAIVFAGNPESEESEGFDRTRLELAAEQVLLIREVAAAAPRTVVVLANGGVVSLEGWHDEVDAILEGFLLGQGGGHALAELLFGVVSPSGRLAETIPLRLEDTPSHLTFPGEQGHVRYAEGVMVGYRHYTTVGAPVRYPFGHGLGYTRFATSDVVVTATGPDAIAVEVTVANVGELAGKHVVQLYLHTDAGPVRRPARVLAAFTKVALDPGTSTRVRLELDRRVLAYWDVELHRFVVATGDYTVQLCADAVTVLDQATIALEGDGIVAGLTLQSTVGEWIAHPVAGPEIVNALMALSAAAGSQAQAADIDLSAGIPDIVGLMPMVQLVHLSGGGLDGDHLLALAAGPALPHPSA